MTDYLLYRNRHILPENRPSYRQQTLTQLERELPKLQTPRNWKRSYNQETGSDIYFNMDTYDVVDTIDEVYDYEAQQALRRRARTTHQGRTSNCWNDDNIRSPTAGVPTVAGLPKNDDDYEDFGTDDSQSYASSFSRRSNAQGGRGSFGQRKRQKRQNKVTPDKYSQKMLSGWVNQPDRSRHSRKQPPRADSNPPLEAIEIIDDEDDYDDSEGNGII